jgi:hypothetical protein
MFSARIVDRFGMGIDGASVLIQQDERSWKARSDDKGRFMLPLPDGVYTLSVERTGFNKLCDVLFMVDQGIPTRREFPMDVGLVIDTVFIRPTAAPAPDPNIGVNGYYSNDKAQRGRTIQAACDGPSGYHVNSNRPLNKYSIPTGLKIEKPCGVTVGAVIYPRAVVRKLKTVNNNRWRSMRRHPAFQRHRAGELSRRRGSLESAPALSELQRRRLFSTKESRRGHGYRHRRSKRSGEAGKRLGIRQTIATEIPTSRDSNQVRSRVGCPRSRRDAGTSREAINRVLRFPTTDVCGRSPNTVVCGLLAPRPRLH